MRIKIRMREKVEIKTKAEILVEFLKRKADKEIYDDFFAFNDLGLPLAVVIANDLCDLNEKGVSILNETYISLLVELDIEDLRKEYNNLDEIFSDGFVPDEDE